MTSRSYLSIGDVLTLLRQEFPDVTISKIRFLESQGLVNPERTPSGYRKFYEQDVERLRWVLRQQRENFLPLKVIKDRLDDDANGATRDLAAPSDATPSAAAPPETGGEPGWDAEGQAREEPVLVGQRTTSTSSGHTASQPPSGGRATSARRGGGTLPGIGTSSPAARATSGELDSPSRPWTAGTPDPGEHAPPVAATPAQPARAEAPDTPVGKRPVKSGPAAPAPERSRRRQGADRQAAGAGGSTGAAAPLEGGASLSLEELSAASGLDADALRELQEYGLLTAVPVAGLDYFDHEALAIATVAAGFARFGVEPRHLRLYKNAADREAGFVEQILLPLVRQRNPEARAKANETAEVLAGLGQELRASLLRLALRGLLER